jgi:phage-related protein (TIGR01555 family)
MTETIEQLKIELDSLNQEVRDLRISNKDNTDGWKNILVGLMDKMDKTKYTTFGAAPFLDDQMLANLYAGDGLSKKVIGAVADDMTRKWIEIESDDKEIIKKELFRLDSQLNFNTALRWMRLYNGSLLIIGAMDRKDLTKPLLIKKGTEIAWLKPVERSSITLASSDFNDDPTSPHYGKVEIYNMYTGVNRKPVSVHRSRVLEFFGEPAPVDIQDRDINTEYWGMSVIEYTWNILKACGSVLQGIVNVLYEFIVGKYKIKGLEDKMAAGNEKLVIQRIEIIQMFKSVLNAVLLDAEGGEDYIRDSASVAGIADLLDRLMMFLAAVSNIPVTRLFGRSPAGMNATGEADLRNYYDDVSTQQGLKLRKPLQRLIDILSTAYGDGKEHTFEFNPLYELTPREKADIEKVEADADHVRIEDQVLSSEEVREKRFPDLESTKKEAPVEEEE